jgi:hypothetical protein
VTNPHHGEENATDVAESHENKDEKFDGFAVISTDHKGEEHKLND